MGSIMGEVISFIRSIMGEVSFISFIGAIMREISWEVSSTSFGSSSLGSIMGEVTSMG